MSKMICKECKSDDVYIVGSDYTPTRSYEIRTSSGGAHCRQPGSISIPMVKYACMECGHVFEQIARESLEEYKKLKPHFT